MFEQFIHRNPFFRFVLPLITGILLKIYLPSFNLPFLLIAITLSLSTIILQLSNLRKKFYNAQISGLLVSLIIFFIGSELVSLKQQNEVTFNNKKYTYLATIIEQPEEKEKTIKAVLQINSYKDSLSWKNSNSKLLTYFEKDSASKSLQLGDEILVNAYINEIKHHGNPQAFNYKNYLKYKEIYNQAYIKTGSFKIIGTNQISFLKLYSNRLRQKLLKTLTQNNITDDEFAVLSALTLGYKNELTPELKESYSATGSMHVLAVSGLHVGIIFIVLSKLLLFLEKNKYGKYIKSFLIILTLFFYAFLTGLSDSVVRACIMFSFVIIGKLFTRQVSIYNSLAASAFLMLIINSYSIMSVGFQLSYLAVISIVFFQPKIYSLINTNNKILDYFWQLVSVAIAAQLGTFPLTIFYFDQFPVYFILSNILIIPLVSITIYLTLILFIFSFSSAVSSFFSWLLIFFTKLLNEGVQFIESLPFSKIDEILLNQVEVFLLFILIMAFSFFIIAKRAYLFRFSIYISIILLLYSTYMEFEVSNKNIFAVHQIQKTSAINFIQNKNAYIISNNISNVSDKNFKYNILPSWQYFGVKKSEFINQSSNKVFHFCSLNNLRIINLYSTDLLKFTPRTKLKTDYIVLSNDIKVKVSDLEKYFDFKHIIFDSSNSFYITNKWVKECEELNLKYHNVLESGAFIHYL